MDDEGKIYDLSLRRQWETKDPVLALAYELTRGVAKSAVDMDPAGQLVAIELTARAVLETLLHARGEAALNQIIVDFHNRCRFYSVKWPEYDQTATVYDEKELPIIAPVVPIKSKGKKGL